MYLCLHYFILILLHFTLGDPGCGGTFTDTEGVIISPNWPNNYAHNRQCIYLIRLPVGEKVSLNFTHMDLETHSGCSFDYVEVGEGFLFLSLK